MSRRLALATFWIVIFTGYIWVGVQLASGEPFDALVLFVVTLFLYSYRNAVRKEAS